MGINQAKPATPSRMRPRRLFLPVMRANWPSVQSKMSAIMSSSMAMRFITNPHVPL